MLASSKPLQCRIMDAKQARRAWLERFFQEYGRRRNELARAAKIPAPQITMILREGDKQRQMGDQIARRLEKWKGLPRGTLDRAPPDENGAVEITPDLGALSPEEETLVLAWRALPGNIKRYIHSLCTEYTAIRLGVPEIRNGTYEAAEKANNWIEPAQEKAQTKRRSEVDTDRYSAPHLKPRAGRHVEKK